MELPRSPPPLISPQSVHQPPVGSRAVLPAAASKARVKTPPVPGAWNPRCEPNGWRVGFYPTRP